MKSIFLITVLCIGIALMSSSVLQKSKFYYSCNNKINLKELDNKLIVRYKQNKRSDIKQISLYPELFDKSLKWRDDSTCIITLPATEKELFKEKILNQSDVATCNPIYVIKTGLEMGVTDEILVQFNDNVSQAEKDKLHQSYGVKVGKTTEYDQILKVPAGSDALEIANKYQESGLTYFSYPNFICDAELHHVTPNDPYFVNQFYLNNTGQIFTDGHSGVPDADIDAPEAWSVTLGNNDIIIAVLDEGVTSDHPDLPNTRQVRLNGSNFADRDPNDPSPAGDRNHGNACAGIVGATQGNEQGISGIAPNCRIMPIRKFYANGSAITPQEVEQAIDFARVNGADVISCSWGYTTDERNFYPNITNAIIRATTLGRNGLGCVVVFSTGNSAQHSNSYDGYIQFPANVDVPGVLTVGASDRNDLQANYSPNGNANNPIDIVAPSQRAPSWHYGMANETAEVWTIDIPGDPGYNPNKNTDGGPLPLVGEILPNTGVNNLSYTARMGGTSAACPQVAAGAALLLSINPNLTQQQVFNILTSTADQGTHYTYTDGVSNELGHGRLNVFRAVSQALNINGPDTVCSVKNYNIPNLPEIFTVTWSSNPEADQSFYLSSNGHNCSVTNINHVGPIALIATVSGGDVPGFTLSSPKEIYLTYTPNYYTFYATLTTGGTTNWLQENNCLLTYQFPGMYSGQIDIQDPTGLPEIKFVTWTKIWQSQGISFAGIGGSADGKNVTATIKPVGGVATFRMEAFNYCGSFTHNYTFVAGESYLCSGIEMLKSAPTVKVYPNPTNGYFTVDYESVDPNSGIEEIILSNNLGTNIIRKKYFCQKTITIDISNLNPGIYFLEIFNGKEWTVRQISLRK